MIGKRQLKMAALAVLLTGSVLFAADRLVAGGSRIHHETANIESRPVGLVLGTAPRLADDTPNLYFQYRMEAAAGRQPHFPGPPEPIRLP